MKRINLSTSQIIHCQFSLSLFQFKLSIFFFLKCSNNFAFNFLITKVSSDQFGLKPFPKMLLYFDVLTDYNFKSRIFIIIFNFKVCIWTSLNPVQDGGRDKKAVCTHFFPVTSTNIEHSPQNFLTFNFNPFATLL